MSIGLKVVKNSQPLSVVIVVGIGRQLMLSQCDFLDSDLMTIFRE